MFGLTNPWVLLGAVMAALALAAGGYSAGHSNGVDSQAAKDQKQFDSINQAITQAKADAARLYREAQDANAILAAERDKLKTTLEQQHANDTKITADLRNKYDSLQLRFRAKGAGAGANGSSPVPPSGNTAVPESAPVVSLPDDVTRSLRQLAEAADQVANDYRKCYGFVMGASPSKQ